jgi:DUF4097 and DUF4098 domain-containing protein YvlB
MRSIVFVVTLLATSGGVAVSAAAQSADFQWSGALARGKTIEVRGVNGSIRAVASDDGLVRVEALRRGRRSAAASVRIEVVEHDEGVTICAVYPDPPRFPDSNTCSPGGGRVNVQYNDVRVDFVVTIPAGVRFIGKTTNGDIRAEGQRDVQAATHNGDIVLELPADLNAELHATTRNGRIDSDFPILATGRLDRRNLTGSIGRGGPALRASTINGNILLWRR